MSRDRRVWIAFGIAATTVLGTRMPHESLVWLVLTLVLTASIAYMITAAGDRGTGNRRSSVLAVATISWLLVPPSSAAFLVVIPDLVVALAVLVFLHLAYGSASSRAPRLDEGGSSWLPRGSVLLVAMLVGLVVAISELWYLLPDALGALYEMDAGAGPLVAAGIVALPVPLFVGIRGLVDRGVSIPEDDGSGDGVEVSG